MGKIILVEVASGQVNVDRLVPLVARDHYVTANYPLFNVHFMRILVGDVRYLHTPLQRITGSDLVIIEIERQSSSRPLTMHEFYSSVKNIQLAQHSFPVMIIYEGSLLQYQKVCDCVWKAELIDDRMHYGLSWRAESYEANTNGDELTHEVKSSIKATMQYLDNDGDISRWGPVNEREDIYPMGIHPVIPSYKSLKRMVSGVVTTDTVIPTVEFKNSTPYQELLIVSMKMNDKLLQQLYGGMSAVTSINSDMDIVGKEILDHFIDSHELLKIGELGPTAVIATANQDNFHPYVLRAMAEVMTPEQRLSIRGEYLTKATLILLLDYSALWVEQQTYYFTKSQESNEQPWRT